MGERVLRAYAVALRQWKEGGMDYSRHATMRIRREEAPWERRLRPAKLHAKKTSGSNGVWFAAKGCDPGLALITKGFNRVFVGRFVRGIQPEDQTDRRGKTNRKQHHAKGHREGDRLCDHGCNLENQPGQRKP